MSELELNPSRNLSHEKEHSFLFIHNQSNKKGDLHPKTKAIPLGQAADANAICLGNKHDILVTSMPIDPAYLEYWKNTLKLTIPQIFTPSTFNTDLKHSVLDCRDELVKFVKAKQQDGIVRKQVILSVFEADEHDIKLLEALKTAGLGEDLSSECNYDLLPLGNKDGFREFCRENKVTQLAGGVFKSLDEVVAFVQEQHSLGHTVVVKSPHGIGGGGQVRLRPTEASASGTGGGEAEEAWKAQVAEWLAAEAAVEAEYFADNAESEHVVDIYIDPTGNHHTAVLFDQLVKNDNVSAGMAYYGAKYPSASTEASKLIMDQVEATVAPCLEKTGYRGPAGVDVLWNPLHFMELNMRTDAITYVKHLTDRLAKNLFKKEAGSVAFMSLVNLPHPGPISTLPSAALAQHDDGIFALSNPNRQEWGFFDVVAVSPLGREGAEKVMARGLKDVWGREKAKEFMNAIFHPHPQFIPVSKYQFYSTQ